MFLIPLDLLYLQKEKLIFEFRMKTPWVWFKKFVGSYFIRFKYPNNVLSGDSLWVQTCNGSSTLLMYQCAVDHAAPSNLESITRSIDAIVWDSLGVLLKMCDTLDLYRFRHPLHCPWGITRPIDVNSLHQPPTVCDGPFIHLPVYVYLSLSFSPTVLVVYL